MSQIPYLGPWIATGGAAAWIALVTAIAAGLLAPAVIVAGDRWPSSRAASIAIGIVPAGLLAIALLASVAIVERARHVIVLGVPAGPRHGVDTFHQWTADVVSQLVIGGVLVAGAPLAAGAVVRSLRLEGWPIPAIATALSGIAVVTGLGLAAHAWPLAWDWSTSGIVRGTAAGWERAQEARLGVLATSLAVALAGGAAAIALGRRGRIAGPAAWAGAVAVVLLGALAWWGTRARAFDAARPLPPSRDGVVAWPLDARVPEVADCGELAPAPVLEVTTSAPHEATFEGRRVDAPTLGADLDTVRRNWSILHPNRSFPGTLLIVADRGLPRSAIAPWLEVARAHGFDDARRVAVRRIVQRTATLHGRVVYRMCDVPL